MFICDQTVDIFLNKSIEPFFNKRYIEDIFSSIICVHRIVEFRTGYITYYEGVLYKTFLLSTLNSLCHQNFPTSKWLRYTEIISIFRNHWQWKNSLCQMRYLSTYYNTCFVFKKRTSIVRSTNGWAYDIYICPLIVKIILFTVLFMLLLLYYGHNSNIIG